MKKFIIAGCGALLLFATSCKKSTDDTASSTDITTQLTAARAIAVSTTNPLSRDPHDSIYAVNTCNNGDNKTIIDFSTLSLAITTYLTTNYTGYTAVKALQITNSSGAVVGYIAVINVNNKPIAIKFDANGAFVKVLELRQGIDILHNKHFHHGGCFDDRDGLQRDSLALAALPVSITSYITTNYPLDILLKAFKGKDSDIVVITKDTAGILYANVFNSNNVFVKRVVLQHCDGRATPIAETALLSSITAYLNTTYTGYTFKQAFSIGKNGIVKRYVVLINANNIKYAVEFDAAGNFIEAHIIH